MVFCGNLVHRSVPPTEMMPVGQNSIDTQDRSSYTPTVKKQCVINQFNSIAEDRAMLIETMTSMKDILEAAITRAVKNKKKPT